MVRALRWLSFVGFMSLPVILAIGRPVQEAFPCPPNSACDVFWVTPGWTWPVFLGVLGVSLLALVLAFLMKRAQAHRRVLSPLR